MSRTIHAASDHAGLELKNHLVEVLRAAGHEVEDHGTHDGASVDYPDFAHVIAGVVAGDEGTEDGAIGLLVCGTGLGMSIAANRHAGVRAALCHDVFSARMTRAHNDANILCMGARVVGIGVAEEVATAFFGGAFEGGRHARRVGKIEPK